MLTALWDPASGSGGVPQLKGAKAFTFEELKKYTRNFSETNNIGAGGYGMVSCVFVHSFDQISNVKRCLNIV